MIRTIDAHVGGGPLRLIVEGFPSPRGRTMLEKRDWLMRHADQWRRGVLLEPRGHTDMCGAILTDPVSPGSHAGVLFMHGGGYCTMSGHGVIAVTTIALERGLIVPGGDGTSVIFDTPAGVIRARAQIRAGGAGGAGGVRVERVAFVNVPSFVLHGGLRVAIGQRKVLADVAFGGAFYAIVDSEAVGLSIDAAHLPELRRAGLAIVRAIEAVQTIAHPIDAGVRGLAGTIFTAPPGDEQSALRNVAIFSGAEAERSPGGTGTAAVMAVVDAMGLIGTETPFVHESLIGTRFTGRIVGRTTVGEYPAIVPEIEGAAWITGDHTFLIDEDDPLKEGFRI
ncbi:MAG TPA: proline racemase family protein [Vicinamibacterales bacterium]